MDTCTIRKVLGRVPLSGRAMSHETLCPRYGVLCECADCLPPICLCNLIRACTTGTPEDIRITFYDAVKNA